jgi:hypothetical protein
MAQQRAQLHRGYLVDGPARTKRRRPGSAPSRHNAPSATPGPTGAGCATGHNARAGAAGSAWSARRRERRTARRRHHHQGPAAAGLAGFVHAATGASGHGAGMGLIQQLRACGRRANDRRRPDPNDASPTTSTPGRRSATSPTHGRTCPAAASRNGAASTPAGSTAGRRSATTAARGRTRPAAASRDGAASTPAPSAALEAELTSRPDASSERDIQSRND